MNKVKLTLLIIFLWALLLSRAYAVQNVDWSTVTLSGTYPSFSFSHSVLGNVSVSYSSDTEFYGIWRGFAEPTLTLGDTGGELLIISWSNPVTNLNMEIWDIDAQANHPGENVTFFTAATTSIVALNPTDVWNPVTKNLSSDGTANNNGEVDNFSVINFSSPVGFNAITFIWEVTDPGGMGIGEMNNIAVVPEPAGLTLFLIGGSTLGFRLFRKKFKK